MYVCMYVYIYIHIHGDLSTNSPTTNSAKTSISFFESNARASSRPQYSLQSSIAQCSVVTCK